MSLRFISLWNSTLWLSEKGFFGIAFILSLFSAIVVQKNTRDNQSSPTAD
ncbi:MAG TPA: YiaA/YiaB family inner membrane protein [Anaerolineales bacterium]|nr:YiaA/YiaB family inner membrane protein [Anaerolineales bacterium]